MAAMVSSLRNKQIYDPIRRCWVFASPEELVRQQLIILLNKDLGYPLSLFAIERSVQALASGGRGRFDLVVVSPRTMRPFILAECKAHRKDREAALFQLFRYDFSLDATYLLVADSAGLICGYKSASEEKVGADIPHFSEC
ncbi:MAG: type I restriction enzyme HsdR N-terminal domain-containing protein [Chlamydiota bacterium]|nr:type I restriction enzyme HsdR N-terminal domain-containing protein [Chlamydiota bacterium]